VVGQIEVIASGFLKEPYGASIGEIGGCAVEER
jgi:hypothetical protein